MEKTQFKKQNSTKSKTKELNKPKSIKNSKKILSSVINYNKLKLYQIKFEEENIKLYVDNKIIDDNELKNKESIILSSFIFKYHDNLNFEYVKLENEIANPIIYIFLLPFVSKDNLFILKLGYTTDLIKRYNQLKKEFDVDEIKLIYSYVVDGEHTELNIHKNLEKNFTSNVYKMIKNKKNEKNEKITISEETYKFTWTLLQNIYKIIYKEYIMKNKLTLMTKELELKKTDESVQLVKLEYCNKQIELKKIEESIKSMETKMSDNQVELKKMELESKMSDNQVELKKMELESKMSDNQVELKKMELESKMSDNQVELKKMETKMSDNQVELKKMETKMSDNQVELKKMELETKKIELELKKIELKR